MFLWLLKCDRAFSRDEKHSSDSVLTCLCFSPSSFWTESVCDIDKACEGMVGCIFWRKKRDTIASLRRLPDSALVLRTFSPQFI